MVGRRKSQTFWVWHVELGGSMILGVLGFSDGLNLASAIAKEGGSGFGGAGNWVFGWLGGVEGGSSDSFIMVLVCFSGYLFCLFFW